MGWKELMLVACVAPIVVGVTVGIFLLFMEYRSGLFQKTTSERGRSILVGIKKVLKFRPRLTIAVKDISCYVKPYKTYYANRSMPAESGMQWHVECAVEIQNKRGVPITDVTGTMKLVLGEEDFIYTKALGNFEIGGNKSQKFLVVFEESKLKFPIKDPSPDLNSSYYLEYVHSYAIDGMTTAKQFKTTVLGNLTKADWIGSLEDLERFRTLGFKR